MKSSIKDFKRKLWLELRRRFYKGGPAALASAITEKQGRAAKIRGALYYQKNRERELERARLRRAANISEFREYDRNRNRISRARLRALGQAGAQISVLKQVSQLSQHNTP